MSKLPRDPDGQLAAYVWPGGYPLYYLDGDGSALCVTCARKSDKDETLSFRPVAVQVNWEDGNLDCEQCSERIESAYGTEEEDLDGTM